MSGWTIEDSDDTYKISSWGGDYFRVAPNGHLLVTPTGEPDRAIDLKLLVDELSERKIQTPILFRFLDILQHRIRNISSSFINSMKDNGYNGAYKPIFPVKVNQQREVVESVIKYGGDIGLGLEVGSKPELLAALALSDEETMIVCNGYKDDVYLNMVLQAHRMGKTIITVIEKYSELVRLVKLSKQMGILPVFGFRVKLSSKGAGRWSQSAGDASKFGLRIYELSDAVQYIKAEGMLDCARLLHFHIGSQITSIAVVKRAVAEAGHIFAELVKLEVPLEYIDVGGGLGVDYLGSKSNSFSSINYSLQEYANDIVYRIKSICDKEGIPHPTILSESGRALTSHYSVLITNICDHNSVGIQDVPVDMPPDVPEPVKDLVGIKEYLNQRNLIEAYHDAIQYRIESLNLFSLGYMSLEHRSFMERVYWGLMSKIHKIASSLEERPPELKVLDLMLSDTYFTNFSIFQSIPDAWAIDQIFPVVPIHRLDEEPDRTAVIADITCDSDGQIDYYAGADSPRRFLPLHLPEPGASYYVGIFLIGAYQEVLGDLHNLFGDTNAVHVELSEKSRGNYAIKRFIRGDTVGDVIGYVQYNKKDLLGRIREQLEEAYEKGRIDIGQLNQFVDSYEHGLNSYTYLE